MTGDCRTEIIVRANISRKIKPKNKVKRERDNSILPVCQSRTNKNENAKRKKLIIILLTKTLISATSNNQNTNANPEN